MLKCKISSIRLVEKRIFLIFLIDTMQMLMGCETQESIPTLTDMQV